MKVASSRPDHLSTLSLAKTSKLSLLVKHHILLIDEASYQQQLEADIHFVFSSIKDWQSQGIFITFDNLFHRVNTVQLG